MKTINAAQSMFKELYPLYIKVLTELSSIFLLIIRLYFGYRFIRSGLGKFENFDSIVEFFTSLNIPFPEVNVMLSASTELFGGILLLLGLASRIIALPLTVTMLVAYATAHSSALSHLFDKPELFFKPEPFLFTTLVVLFFGAGKYFVDALVPKNVSKKNH